MKMKNKTFKEFLCDLEGKSFFLFTIDKTFSVDGKFEIYSDGILFSNKFVLFNKVIGVQIIGDL